VQVISPGSYASKQPHTIPASPWPPAQNPGLALGQIQGAPGVAAGMRYLTSDPRCRPAKAGSPRQETAMRRLALALAAGGVLAASPATALAATVIPGALLGRFSAASDINGGNGS